MGAGASAVDAQTAIAGSSAEQIQQVIDGLSEADRQRLAGVVLGDGGAAEAADCRVEAQGLLVHASREGTLAEALKAVTEAKASASGAGKCPFAGIVKATAGAVAPNVPAIVNDFYSRLFEQNPETKAFFNPANQFGEPPKQRNALANAVVAYASNIEDLTPLLGPVEIIAHKHAALRVAPVHYEVVHKHLMASIGHILGEIVTPEIGTGWSDAVLALAKILIEKEEELYKMAESRTGGWRGAKDFKVAKKRQVTESCVELTFEAVDGAGPIDFTPGQFLTIHLKKEGATPRHYTVTSKPGESFLQCCVKKQVGGFVSNAVHEMAEGEIVGLSAPFGTYGLKERPIVLVSAGIGVTPMKAFMAVAADRVKLAVHVDKSEAEHPFKEDFSSVPCHFHYTQASGRPLAAKLVADVLQPHLSACDFYVCGPAGFQKDLKESLEAGGAKVFTERFGPELQ